MWAVGSAAFIGGSEASERLAGGAVQTLVVVGTYTSPLGHAPLAEGEGIYVYRLSEETGDLTPLHTARNIEQPSFLALAPTRSTLYATKYVLRSVLQHRLVRSVRVIKSGALASRTHTQAGVVGMRA